MTDVLVANGRNGQVHFDGRTVTITREGFAARATHGRGEKSIPLRHIAAVQFKPVALLTTGYIQFTVPGELASTRRSKGSRTIDAASDENSVIFLKKQQPEFEALKDAVRSAIADL